MKWSVSNGILTNGCLPEAGGPRVCFVILSDKRSNRNQGISPKKKPTASNQEITLETHFSVKRRCDFTGVGSSSGEYGTFQEDFKEDLGVAEVWENVPLATG